jgi:hypothetical protein
MPLIELPYLFTEGIGPSELATLADALERALAESAPAQLSR